MAKILNISEGASLALHACLVLAGSEERLFTAREIAETFDVSEAHLAKVLQRLARLDLVRSVRGARGGFALARRPEQMSLLEIYEAIDGPLTQSSCLFSRPLCDGTTCIFGPLLGRVHQEVRERLASTTLADLRSWKAKRSGKKKR